MTRFFLRLKALLKRRSTYVFIIVVTFLTAVLSTLSLPDIENTEIGIITNNSVIANNIAAGFDKSSIFKPKIYDSRDSMEKDIISGRCECGFVFNEEFDKLVQKGKLKESIEYVCGIYTTKGEVAKESLYAQFLKIYSERILSDEYENIYGEQNEENLKELLNKNAYYLDSSDIFTVDFHYEVK